MKILWVGCGQLGQLYAQNFAQDQLIGLKRSINVDMGLRSRYQNLTLIPVDILDFDQMHQALKSVQEPDAIVYSVTPNGRDEQAYYHAYLQGVVHMQALMKLRQWDCFWLQVGSCGVFGQNQGEWVSELTRPQPQNWRHKILLKSEHQVQTQKKSSILRLAGIYGGRRNALIRRVASAIEQPVVEPMNWSNRIHEQDAVGLIHHLLHLSQMNPEFHLPVIHGVDYKPSLLGEVMQYIAQQKFHSQLEFLDAQSSQSDCKNHLFQNKKVKSEVIHTCGYRFIYRSFYDGYI